MGTKKGLHDATLLNKTN